MELDRYKLRCNINDILSLLPKKADDIAYHFKTIKCGGIPNNTEHCPIACYLRNKVSIQGITFLVSGTLIAAVPDEPFERPVLISKVPNAVKEFIYKFDRDKYPELICNN